MSKEQKKVTKQANGKGKGIDKALVAAAEDINEVFKPDPVLDTAAKTLAEDLKELFPAMGKGKGLKAETIKTLKELGFLEKAKPVEKPVAKAEGKGAGKVGKGKGAVKGKTGGGMSSLGHVLSAQSGAIDQAIEGKTAVSVEKLVTATKLSAARIRSHLVHLKKEHGWKGEIKD